MKAQVFISPYAVGVASRFGAQILAFVQIMIAARYLGLADFGSYALGWAVCVIFVSFVYTGFYQSLLRSENFEDHKHTGFWSMGMIGGSGSVVLIITGLVMSVYATSTAGVFLAFAALPSLAVANAWMEVHLVREQRIRLVSIYTLISECVAVGVLYVCVTQGWGIFALVFARYAAVLVVMTIVFTVTRAVPRFRFSRSDFGELRKTAFPLWGTSALGMFTIYGADLILGAFLNTAAVGAYRGGSRIAQTASDLVFQPLYTISWSRFSQLEKQKKSDQITTAWLEHMGFGALLLWPVLASIATLSTDLVLFLFDETWLPAASIIVILAVARGLSFFSALLEPTMTCKNKGYLQIRVRLAGGAILLISLFSFGRFSAEHAATAQVVTSGLVACMSMYVMLPTLQVSVRRLATALAPAAIVTIVCLLGLNVSVDAREALGSATGLMAAVAALAPFWLLAVSWCLKRNLVALPNP